MSLGKQYTTIKNNNKSKKVNKPQIETIFRKHIFL